MQDSLVLSYLDATPREDINPAALAFYASLDEIRKTSPSVAASIVRELVSQRSNVKLIASENYSSLASQLAHGNLFIDKYAEGYPQHRFYAGCENVDDVETEAAGLACELFGAEHAYVQPHSGADANLVAFLAILNVTVESPALARLGVKSPVPVSPEDWSEIRDELHNRRLLAMDFFSGGHLSHGYRFNLSSRLFDAHLYTVDRETMRLDLDALRRQALEVRPHVLLAGYSSYTRHIDFARLREIADEVGAVLMVDMAHFAGLVAGKVFTGDHNPVPYAQVLSTTTHKTLRGPRGGMVLCNSEFAEAVDKGCPTVLGGPLPQVLAAKAVSFREALQPGFSEYAHRIVANARTLADELQRRGMTVPTGGTDNHIVLADVRTTYGLSGWQAEGVLRECGLTLNRNVLPFDANGPWYTSGLRLGSSAITTLGMGGDEIAEIADVMETVLSQTQPGRPISGENERKATLGRYEVEPSVVEGARTRIRELLDRYPVYPAIDLDVISSTEFGRQSIVDGDRAMDAAQM
ncbi:MAG: aminotransferase class I/II-fold pyridoxal phosphate-dependent enzyme [Gaiellaceae bacterium]